MQTPNLEKLTAIVQDRISHHDSSHAWWHIEDVVTRANFIAKKEGANPGIVQAGALLHESYDQKLVPKGCTKTTEEITEELKDILQSVHFSQTDIEQIVFIAKNVGFKGGQRVADTTPEFDCVQDADFLTALGAVAIGRTFAYGGENHRPLYTPNEQPRNFANREEYYATANGDEASSLGHLQDKLLRLLPEGYIVTETGRALAKPLHDFTQLFYDQFIREITHTDLT